MRPCMIPYGTAREVRSQRQRVMERAYALNLQGRKVKPKADGRPTLNPLTNRTLRGRSIY